MKSYLLCLFFLLNCVMFGQNSLKTQTAKKKADSLRVSKILNLGIQEKDTLKQLEYFEKSLSISKINKYNFGIFSSNKRIANWKKNRYNTDSTIAQLKKGVKELQLKSVYQLKLLLLIGEEFKRKSAYDSAVYYTQKEINLAKKTTEKEHIIRGYILLGNIWYQKFEHDKAFLNYAKADSICNNDKAFETSTLHAQIYNYMGYAVRTTHGYAKSLEFYKKAKKVYQKLNNTFGVQEVNTAIAQAYISLKKYDEALKLLNESISYQEKLPIHNSYSYAIIVRGFLLSKMHKLKLAKKDYQLYYSLAVQTKNRTYQRWGLGYLANFYYMNKEYAKAIIFYNKVIKLCKEENDFGNELEYTLRLIDAYKHTNNFKKATETYDKYIFLLKKIEKKNINKETHALEIKYQTQKKEHEIALLKAEKNIAKQQKINQRNLLLAGIGLSSFVGVFFFFSYRNRKKTMQKLKELDQLKTNLFTNISHEFRTPLTLISSPIQQQLKKKNISNKDRTSFEIIQNNATRLLDLVNQLLDISKIEVGSLKLKIAHYNLASFYGKLLDGFSFMANQKEIDFKVKINPTPKHTWFDKDILEKISTNLLSNAIKYTPIKGTIITEVFVKENKLNFIVKNTGSGISSSKITKIFDRFYQLNNNSEGTGIGLALVKELVLLHKGKIKVESIPNQWTTFTVLLPVNKKAFKIDEIITEPLINKNTQNINFKNDNAIEFQNDTINEETENPIALIVEDNKEVNNYIGTLLKDEYTIIQAVNGEEGIKLALEYVPDIIISDIMMPIKDGITLCNTLKTDERTSHIPIILLTAKSGEENQIKGIKVGADAYITKPFNNDLLVLKVEQLIAIRKKLQTRYSQEVILKPTDIAVNSIDERFLERVQKVLDTNLVESSFHVNEFSKAVGMSRMQLHRKLKVLTGLSTTEFIRSQRLKLAAQLLKASDINISQVGYSVGFNDHAYFSKCFKKVYKCSPSEYAKK